MPRLILLKRILKQTGADRAVMSFLGFVLLCSFLFWVWEPGIHSFGDGFWYCYAVITTIGFGDVVVHTPVARILSVLLSVYAIFIIAIITGLVVNYYMQIVELRQKETLAGILDRLEHLPELDRKELEEISERVKKFRDKS